jgi:hypothetical protein
VSTLDRVGRRRGRARERRRGRIDRRLSEHRLLSVDPVSSIFRNLDSRTDREITMPSQVAFPIAPTQEVETGATQTAVADQLCLIRAEYLEIPGLSLTRKQAQRLWSLDERTCDTLFETLVDVKFLRRTPTGGYVRAD